jgi:hypothetical protein
VFLQIEVMKLNGFLKVNDSWYTGWHTVAISTIWVEAPLSKALFSEVLSEHMIFIQPLGKDYGGFKLNHYFTISTKGSLYHFVNDDGI